MKKWMILTVTILCTLMLLTGCSDKPEENHGIPIEDSTSSNATGTISGVENLQPEIEKTEEIDRKEQSAMKIKVQIGTYTFAATLEDNKAADEFVKMMESGSVTINMDDYGGFEKVGSLGKSLTTSNSQMATTVGDIVLYNGNSIVLFYGSNSWNYTRLGRIDDLTGLEDALGSGSVTVVFTRAE